MFLKVIYTWRAQNLFTHNMPGMHKKARTSVLASGQRLS